MADPIPAIIVVEDAPDILIVLRRLLHDLQLAYDVITTDNAASALAQATLRPCALLITDYMLGGGMNGLELAREFRSRWQCPAVMITAYATPALRASAEAAGVTKVIAKPFYVDDLEATARTILSLPA